MDSILKRTIVRTYVSRPPTNNTENAILYLPDAFGLDLVENRLLVSHTKLYTYRISNKYHSLADTMARAGYLVVLPDYFKNEPVPKNTTGFDMTAWLNRHPPTLVEPIIDTTIKYMRSEFGVKNIGVVGYCFGGRYVARLLAPGKGIQAGFTAHPSMVTKPEWQAISAPLSIAAAGKSYLRSIKGLFMPLHDAMSYTKLETDSIFPTPVRRETEDVLQKLGIPYQVTVYGGTQHGFGVRVDLKNSKQKFAKESAFYQAIRWFDQWVKK